MGEQAEQLAKPILNEAAFQSPKEKSAPKIGVYEISYSLALRFRKKNMELRKIYRFYKSENYFRQITILRNLERQALDFSFEARGKKILWSPLLQSLWRPGPSYPKPETKRNGLGRLRKVFLLQ